MNLSCRTHLNSPTRSTEHDPGPNSIGHASPKRYTQVGHDPDLTTRRLVDHDPGSQIQTNLRTITIEDCTYGFRQIISKQQLKKYTAAIRTLYKRKDKKIRY